MLPLEQARDDNERALLGPRLDLHIADAADGIDRHVTKQQDELARQIISERQTLIQRAAELDHNNDDKLAGLAEAHASAAQELARMNGEPDGPASDAARSAIWRTAIGQRLATGNDAQAVALFDRVKDLIAPDDRRHLDLPLQAAAMNRAADQWIERESAKPGDPLTMRLQADPDLSPLEKAVVRTKVDARDSAQESRRAATVMGLDDRLGATAHAVATMPATYKSGTLAALANAYDEAGEPDRATAMRRLALQEPLLLPFTQASAAKQQAAIDALPEEVQPAAKAILRQQAEAFARILSPPEPPCIPTSASRSRSTTLSAASRRLARSRSDAASRSRPITGQRSTACAKR